MERILIGNAMQANETQERMKSEIPCDTSHGGELGADERLGDAGVSLGSVKGVENFDFDEYDPPTQMRLLAESLLGDYNHLVYEELEAYVEGTREAYAQQLEAHLSKCEDCRKEVYALLVLGDGRSLNERAGAFLLPYLSRLLVEPKVLETYTGKVERIEGSSAFLSLRDSNDEPYDMEYEASRLTSQDIGEGSYVKASLVDTGNGSTFNFEAVPFKAPPALEWQKLQQDLDDKLAKL